MSSETETHRFETFYTEDFWPFLPSEGDVVMMARDGKEIRVFVSDIELTASQCYRLAEAVSEAMDADNDVTSVSFTLVDGEVVV